MGRPPYTTGLHELGDGLHAWLQPDGGWGWSNAGLVRGEGASLLVDTLFDPDLTGRMLEAMAPLTDTAPLATLVNTHANGDHCYGNGMVHGAETVTSARAAEEMTSVPPSLLGALVSADLGDPVLEGYVRDAFGPFRFEGVEVPAPDRTFSGRLPLRVGGVEVELLELGPAHTGGDVVVHVPSAATVFAGDLAFIGGTPIVWAGPVSGWLRAIEVVAGLGVDTVVPGHGPVCGTAELLQVADYLSMVDREATARFEAGMSTQEAVADIDLGAYADWGEWERIVVNVDTVYRHLDPTRQPTDVVTLFSHMAHLRAGISAAACGGNVRSGAAPASDDGYWFAASDGVDLIAAGGDFVFVGGPFTAALLDRRSGIELEHVNHEEAETERDPEDQFLGMAGSGDAETITVGSRSVTLVPGTGEIVSRNRVEGFVPAANPLEAGTFTVTNSLDGLAVEDGSGGNWVFEVDSPMYDEGPVVGLGGWVFAPTSSGEIVAVELERAALDAAESAWRSR